MNTQRVRPLPQSAVLMMSLVLGSNTHRVTNLINHWISNSGAEWTVARLKALRVAALQLKAGSPERVKAIYKANSIAYFKGTLLPRGPMKLVVEGFVNSRKPSNVKAWDAVLRVYTSIRLTKPSQAQVSKAKKSITGPFTGSKRLLGEIERVMEIVGREMHPFLEPPEQEDLARLKAFTGVFRVPTGAKVSAMGYEKGMQMPYSKLAASLITSGKWPESVARARTIKLQASGEVDYIRQFRATLWESAQFYDCDHSGQIELLQEAGCKARVVAKANAWGQWFFEPLHRSLHKLQEWFEASMVDDQVDGAYWAIQQLKAGKKLWCYDLSSATDRFPRSLQLAFLRGLGLSEYADDLESYCKNWIGLDGTNWDYAVGQPMGLYSSFPLFHLVHLLLLRELTCMEVEKDRAIDGYPFRVLGDDVIISDRGLARSYLTTMEMLGVDISDAKTVTSTEVAEFAGFVVLRSNRTVWAYRPYKYGKRSKGIHAPVNVLASFGSRARRLGSSWNRYFERYQRTRSWRHPDLSPLLDISPVKGGLQPPVLSTTRLENLLMAYAEANQAFALVDPGSSYDDPEDRFFAEEFFGHKDDILQRAAKQLLGKQLPGENLLSTPKEGLQDDSDVEPTPDLVISSDPLMRVQPNRTDPWSVSMLDFG